MISNVVYIVKSTYLFLKDIYDKRYTIYELTKRDFKTMYTGSALGLIWSFIQPLAMTVIFWFVFSKGFRVLPVENVPFIIWLLGGLIPWYFFSNCLSTNTAVLFEYGYLVKKTNFRVSILPIVKILSALIVHTIFLFILVLFLFVYHIPVSVYWVQTLYYTVALIFLLLGLSWITSSINVFLKDVAQIIGILLQLGFWITPIFWNYTMFPKQYLNVLRLNPLFYIIQGYRNSFIYQIPFWDDLKLTFYYWSVAWIAVVAGILIYKRLRPHFADVI
jgi:ABC-type polysaccharide/polyol phosphate export permease